MGYEADAGSVTIIDKKIELTTFTGSNPQNIYHLVAGMDIYGSLDNYTLTADIFVSEGIELLNYLPAGGEEKIKFKIKTPDSGKTISYDFFVESITNLQSNDMSNLKSYVFRCVTMDAMKNSFLMYSKRYKDMEYDAALKEVIEKDLGSSKPVKTPDKTKGFFDYTVNRVRPYQTVDLITERAVSTKYKGSDYIFYEDNEAYNFCTIEHLIETRKGKAENFKFNYPTANKTEEIHLQVNHRNILKYEMLDQGDSMNKIKQGAFRNKYMEFDILHGDYFLNQEYVNSSDHEQFKKTDANYDVHSSAFNSYAEAEPAYTRLLLKDGTRPEMQFNQNMHWKNGFRRKVYQGGLNIRVYGDTNLLVGDLIEVKIPEISGLTVEPPDQLLYSGNFLVRTCRHLLNRRRDGSGAFEHFMVLDCRRPNLKRPLG